MTTRWTKPLACEFSFSRLLQAAGDTHDTYTVKRTEDGWDRSSHIAIGGPCDKGGRPYLFGNLRHDSIQFSQHGLDGWMEWLWEPSG
jgi:hypothetical protein